MAIEKILKIQYNKPCKGRCCFFISKVKIMTIVKSQFDLNNMPEGCVLTIGNFDGVHAGHCKILSRARELAVQKKTFMTAMTFEPHPVAVLHPEQAPGVLTPLFMKLHRFKEFADVCIVIKDKRKLLDLSAEAFVEQFIMQHIKPSVIVEGDDFNFGANRQGDIGTLSRLGKKYGFDTDIVESKQISLASGQNLRVSSTLIRYMLESAHVSDAACALQRFYRLTGRIITGRGKGRVIGYPTLNMEIPAQILPAQGVYAGFVFISDSKEGLLDSSNTSIPAVFSLGQARTFGSEYPLLIESHLLNGDFPDMTGKFMAMDFAGHLRSQHKFNSVSDLVKQIDLDCIEARELLAALKD